MRTRTLIAGAVVALLGFALPSVAGAATATISNEAGTDVPLTAPTTITNMAPVLKLSFAESERRFAVLVLGPDGTTAAASQACVGVASYRDLVVNYQGNGKYTVAITTSTDPSDISCSSPVSSSTTQAQFTIAATAKASVPGKLLLTRRPGSDTLRLHTAAISASPGADAIEIQYARNVTPKSDGSLPGRPAGGIYPVTQSTAPLTLARPGRYALIARPRLGTGVGPWSAPVYVDVAAPFDFTAAPTFADGHGPTYTLKGDVRAALPKKSKIKVLLAHGRKHGKFHKLKTIKTGKHGHFTLKFSLDKPGHYRLRYRFAGNKTVAGGRVTQAIKIAKVKV